MLLGFRILLKFLTWAFGRGEFTVRDVYSRVQPYLPLMALSMLVLALRIYLRFSMNSVSNDLGRLYHMHFLSRRRVKRLIRAGSEKLCFRGYEYKYFISS